MIRVTPGCCAFDDQAKLNAMAAERAAAGFQLGFHAIGDRANEVALDAFSAAEQVARLPGQIPAPKDPDAAIVSHVESGGDSGAVAVPDRACAGRRGA